MQIVFYLIWLILLSILQPTLAREIEIFGIAPNLFLCFVILSGFFRGKMEGAYCGAGFGLIYDIFIGRMIGVSSLIFLYAGFGAGVLSERFFSSRKRMAAMIMTLIATLLYGIIYYLARLMIHGDIGFTIAFFRVSLPEAIYNCFICFIMSFPVAKTLKSLRVSRIS